MKTIGRLILSAIFLVLTGVMVAAAMTAPEFVFSFYPAFSRKILASIANATAVVPFAVWEIAALLAILWMIYTLVRAFSQRRGFFLWLSGVVLAASVIVFAFVGLWGLNHFGPGIAQSLSLDVREYSRAELADATRYYAAQVTALSDQVTRDEQELAHFSDFGTLAKQAGEGYKTLAETNAQFDGSTVRVKRILSWPLFSRFGTTGIFICLTGESCVNPDTYEAWIPFTMCHEIGHRQAVAAEDEANFCAYLACMENSSAEFRYSGAMAAYVYCHNALYKADSAAATEIWNALPSAVRADIAAANRHYAQYEGKVQDAAQKVNDMYLKAFSEESGVQSYGEVADLLIAWYQKENAKS